MFSITIVWLNIKIVIKHINVYFVAKTLKCVSVHFVPNLFVSKQYNHTHVHFVANSSDSIKAMLLIIKSKHIWLNCKWFVQRFKKIVKVQYFSFQFSILIKSSQNKKDQKKFQVDSFLCLFLQLAAEKKTPKTVHLEFFLALLILKRL